MVLVYYARRLLRSRRPPGDAASGGLPDGGQPDGGQPDGGQRGRWPSGLLEELRNGPTVSRIEVPLAVQVVRLLVLVVVVVTVPFASPRVGDGGQGIAVGVALGLSAVAWLIWNFAGDRPRLWLAMLAVMGAAGGALAGLSSLSTAVAVGFVVTISAGARLSADLSVAIVAETVAAFLIAGIVSGAAPEAIIGWTAGLVGLWAFGLTRRAYLLRAIEAEQALEQARRAHAAETQAAALAERARIAREIHDVLAHALAAVSVNLQAAEGLLDAVPDKGPELAKVVECVERAGALTKEGMAEARRAILALREESAGAPAGYASYTDGRPAGPEAAAEAAGSGSGAEAREATGNAGVGRATGTIGTLGAAGMAGAVEIPWGTRVTGAPGVAGVRGAAGGVGGVGDAGGAGGAGGAGDAGGAGAVGTAGAIGAAGAVGAVGTVGAAGGVGAAGLAAPADERLTSRLLALADEHRAAGDTAVEFTVAGTPRPLGAERALTVYRTAQEALTNARKHAPGQPVSLAVTYAPGEMTLQVSNPLPPAGTEGPLAHAGTGYGLSGLRERAALVNGTLTVAAGDGQWKVRLTLPG